MTIYDPKIVERAELDMVHHDSIILPIVLSQEYIIQYHPNQSN
jgi:hypothetical protein